MAIRRSTGAERGVSYWNRMRFTWRGAGSEVGAELLDDLFDVVGLVQHELGDWEAALALRRLFLGDLHDCRQEGQAMNTF